MPHRFFNYMYVPLFFYESIVKIFRIESKFFILSDSLIGFVRSHLVNLKLSLLKSMRKPTVIVIVIFLLLNLRVVGWFEPGYPVFEGDIRLPIVPRAYATQSFYTWNEIDFGVPSVYYPRLMDPFFVLMYAFEQIGASVYFSQMLSTYIVYVLVSIFVFFYIRNMLRGDVIAAFVAAVFFTSNLYLLVDTQTSAISYMEIALTILPCLTVFSEGLKRKSFRFVSLSGLLFVLSFATFPNYRAALMSGILLFVTLIAVEGKRVMRKQVLKYLATFAVFALIASIWLFAYIFLNWQSINASTSVSSTPVPFYSFVNGFDVPRLLSKWTFTATETIGSAKIDYVPYSGPYLYTNASNIALILITFMPLVFAFHAFLTTKFRRRAIFFGVLALIFLVLTTGFTIDHQNLYVALVNSVPLMKAFREPASWTLFVVLFYGVLIGMFASSLSSKVQFKVETRNQKTLLLTTKRKFGTRILSKLSVRVMKHGFRLASFVSKLVVLGGIVVVLFAAVYPMFTGEVTQNWLDTKHKGSFIPEYFTATENILPSDGWTILLPQRYSYVTYNFSEAGMLNAGNPYPFLYSKPLLYGTGTEYIKSPSSNVINYAYDLLTNQTERARPTQVVPNCSFEDGTVGWNLTDTDSLFSVGFSDDAGVGKSCLRVTTNLTVTDFTDLNSTYPWSRIRSYDISVVRGTLYKVSSNLKTVNVTQSHVALEAFNETSSMWDQVFQLPSGVDGTWPWRRYELIWNSSIYSKVRFLLNAGTLENSKTGNATTLFDNLSLSLSNDNLNNARLSAIGLLGIRNLLVEDKIVLGDINSRNSINCNINLEGFDLVQNMTFASLYANSFAKLKIYCAEKVLFEKDLTNWHNLGLTPSGFENLCLSNVAIDSNNFVIPGDFSFEQKSPVLYEADGNASHPFVLVFLNNYDPNWKIQVNGNTLSESDHFLANGFANGWIIRNEGRITMEIKYTVQETTEKMVAISVLFSLLLSLVLWKKLWRLRMNRKILTFRAKISKYWKSVISKSRTKILL
jgi:hypothetical protein